MSTNPYQSPIPNSDHESNTPARPCPECGATMEEGYVTTGAKLYWRTWDDKSWLVSSANGLAGTGPAFVGSNKLSGFRCPDCELILMRYGAHKNAFQTEPQDG